MKEKQWGEHEVCELAKINFNSFRKFQKKDPKLSNTIVNKILKLFDIVN
jgi:DNA-directed RNA polymerase subunit F